jgi:hypothetical protein
LGFVGVRILATDVGVRNDTLALQNLRDLLDILWMRMNASCAVGHVDIWCPTWPLTSVQQNACADVRQQQCRVALEAGDDAVDWVRSVQFGIRLGSVEVKR